jgi:hypothetical protein
MPSGRREPRRRPAGAGAALARVGGTQRVRRRAAMVRLELDRVQADMLREMLESYLGDLRMEISQTDRLDFREDLKKREVLLKELIARLEQPG